MLVAKNNKTRFFYVLYSDKFYTLIIYRNQGQDSHFSYKQVPATKRWKEKEWAEVITIVEIQLFGTKFPTINPP